MIFIGLITLAAAVIFIFVHLTAYAVRWAVEGRWTQDERSLAEAPLSGALHIAAEILSSGTVLLLLVVDLALIIRHLRWKRPPPAAASAPAPPPGDDSLPPGAGPPPPPGTARRPVVLLHGAGMRGLTMAPLARKLRSEGLEVHLFTYWPPGLRFEAYARQLSDYLESIRGETGGLEFDAVGHSMGGLILRRFIVVLNGPVKIRRLVTLGTPHGGSVLWRFAPPALGRQLRPGGEFLRRFDEAGLPPGVEATAISGGFDQLVVPNANARWEGATNHTIPDAGHTRLIFHRETLRIVLGALDQKTLTQEVSSH